MPKSLRARLSAEKVLRAQLEFAEGCVAQWEKKRPAGHGEHWSQKGLSRDNMISLAIVAQNADDWAFIETRRGGANFTASDASKPGHWMHFLVGMLYREFGYVICFLQHVRDSMAPEMGFRINPRTKIRERVVDADGKEKATGATLRRVVRNPEFARYVSDKYKAPGYKDIAAELEKSGRYKVSRSAINEASRSKK